MLSTLLLVFRLAGNCMLLAPLLNLLNLDGSCLSSGLIGSLFPSASLFARTGILKLVLSEFLFPFSEFCLLLAKLLTQHFLPGTLDLLLLLDRLVRSQHLEFVQGSPLVNL